MVNQLFFKSSLNLAIGILACIFFVGGTSLKSNDTKKLDSAQSVDIDNLGTTVVSSPFAPGFLIFDGIKIIKYSASLEKTKSISIDNVDLKTKVFLSGSSFFIVGVAADGTLYNVKIFDFSTMKVRKEIRLKNEGVIEDIGWDEKQSVLFVRYASRVDGKLAFAVIGYEFKDDKANQIYRDDVSSLMAIDFANKIVFLGNYFGIVSLYNYSKKDEVGQVEYDFPVNQIVLMGNSRAVVTLGLGSDFELLEYSNKITSKSVEVPDLQIGEKRNLTSSGFLLTEKYNNESKKYKSQVSSLELFPKPKFKNIGFIENEFQSDVVDTSAKNEFVLWSRKKLYRYLIHAESTK